MSKELESAVPSSPRSTEDYFKILCNDFAGFHVDLAVVNVDEQVQNAARKLRNTAAGSDVDKKIAAEKKEIEDKLKELERKKKEQAKKSFAARGRWKQAQKAALMSVKIAAKVQRVERRNSVNREMVLKRTSVDRGGKSPVAAADKAPVDKAPVAATGAAAADKADKAPADKAPAAVADSRADTPSPSAALKNKNNTVVPEPQPEPKLENDEHLIVVKGKKKGSKGCVIC